MEDAIHRPRESISRTISKLICKGYLERIFSDGKTVITVTKRHTLVDEKLCQNVTGGVTKHHSDCDETSQGVCRNVTETVTKRHTKNIKENKISNSLSSSVSYTEQNIPTLKNVVNYFVDQDLNGDAEKFFRHYSEHGWTYLGKPIEWKQAAQNWSDRERDKSQRSYNKSQYLRRALNDPLVYRKRGDDE